MQAEYRQLAVEQRQSAAAALVAAAGAAICTPELRRTVSQPPSPSKSVPGVLPLGLAQGGEGASSPAAVASALPPFLPPSQAKQAHKVGTAASFRHVRWLLPIAVPVGLLQVGCSCCLILCCCHMPPCRCGCSPLAALPAAERAWGHGGDASQTP